MRCNPCGVPSISVTPTWSISGRRISCNRGFNWRALISLESRFNHAFVGVASALSEVALAVHAGAYSSMIHTSTVSAVPAIGSLSDSATSAQYSRCIWSPG